MSFFKQFGDCFPPSIKLSAWRVKDSATAGKTLQSVHQGKFPSSHFIIIEVHVSDNYIVAVLHSKGPGWTLKYAFQVRSAADFSLVHNLKHHGFMFFPLIMVGDRFLIQVETKATNENIKLK